MITKYVMDLKVGDRVFTKEGITLEITSINPGMIRKHLLLTYKQKSPDQQIIFSHVHCESKIEVLET